MNGGSEMDKKLKQALDDAYRAPDPVRKAAFLTGAGARYASSSACFSFLSI